MMPIFQSQLRGWLGGCRQRERGGRRGLPLDLLKSFGALEDEEEGDRDEKMKKESMWRITQPM